MEKVQTWITFNFIVFDHDHFHRSKLFIFHFFETQTVPAIEISDEPLYYVFVYIFNTFINNMMALFGVCFFFRWFFFFYFLARSISPFFDLTSATACLITAEKSCYPFSSWLYWFPLFLLSSSTPHSFPLGLLILAPFQSPPSYQTEIMFVSLSSFLWMFLNGHNAKVKGRKDSYIIR